MSDYIFEAKTIQTANIKALFDLLKSVIMECNLVISKDGIKNETDSSYLTKSNKFADKIEIKMILSKIKAILH
jgi:hypothetical protein